MLSQQFGKIKPARRSTCPISRKARQMAKRNERKKKERERRVAQKKIAAAQKRAQEKAAKEADNSLPKTKKAYTVDPLPKKDYAASNRKSPFIHRRTGG